MASKGVPIVLRIGTRGSRLALAQAREIKRRLESTHPEVRCRLVTVKTMGDEFQSVELFKKTAIGVFTKAIEQKLLEGGIDLAIHSLKDLPTDLPKGLVLAAVPKRRDPRDVLISRRRHSLATLPRGAAVATSSPRRQRQIFLARPDLKLCDIRGNLDTRVSKVLREKKYDAVCLARAGLERLGKYLRWARPIALEKVLPAAGQGALGIETRKGDARVIKMARALNHPRTEKEALAERSFLAALSGGCRVPAGVCSTTRNGKIFLKAAVFSVGTSDFVKGKISGPERDYEKIGAALARELLRKGAGRFLNEARSGDRK